MAALARVKSRGESERGDSGFSMVELIVAMMILGVVLIAMAAVQISALVTVTEARKFQQATAFANEAAEQMHAIPWNTLSKGMYSGFLTASGGDPLVSAGILNVDGKSVPLIIAPPSADQDLDDPARPLFDATGSHTQSRYDPSIAGTPFTIKAYVTESSTGPSSGIVGIAVVVEWQNRYGGVSRTTVWSEAYRGGVTSCGDADTQPFLAACQSFFEASAGSGNVSAEVSAVNIDPDPALVGPQPLMIPGSSNEYAIGFRTAGAAASLRSQQVNLVDAILSFGGNSSDDGDPASPMTTRGFAVHTLRATDDVTNQSGWLPNPLDLSVTQGAIAETSNSVSDSPASPVLLWTRSDYARTGTADASMTTSCMAGIPAGSPCARASLANSSDLASGSGLLIMELDGVTFRLSRRLSNEEPGNVDSAWVARFVTAQGTAAVGCTTLSGAGCASAGATRTMARMNIGRVVTGSTTWNGAAPQGMAILEGRAGCPASQNGYYGESVLVQRGASQTTTAPTYERCGQLRYWNGTAYTPIPIDKTTSATYDTAPVTWTQNDYTIIATTQIQILPAHVDNPTPTDPNCRTTACTVSVSAGTILFNSVYYISWTGHEHYLVVTTTVTSPSAQASFTAAPSA